MKSLWLIPLTSALAIAQPTDQKLLSLVSSEQAFAAATARLGVRDGFLTFFADDAISFEPVLGRYKEALEKRPTTTHPLAFLLRWAPEEGDVSASGDIGWLTGPFTVESTTPSSEPPPGGWYFSVWKRQADSTWKVYIDVGIETPAHGIRIDSVQFVPAPLHGTGSSGGTTSALSEADVRMNQALAGAAPGVDAPFASSARMHRNGRFPIKGMTEIRSFLRANPYGQASPLRAEVSGSGDVGLTFGTYQNTATSGYYVRIWKFTVERTWTAVLDVTTKKSPSP